MSPARHCAKIAWASRVLPGPSLWVKWRELRDEHQAIPVWPIWHNKTPQHNQERNRNSSRKVLSPQHSITVFMANVPMITVQERLRLAKLVSATDHTCPFDLTKWRFIPITLAPQIPLPWQTIVSKSHLLVPTTTRKKWQNKKRHFGSVHCWVWPRTAEDPANTWNGLKTMFKSSAGWFESGRSCCFLRIF